MIRFDFVLWEKFKGHPDKDIEALALMRYDLFHNEQESDDYRYYQLHYNEMLDNFGELLPEYYRKFKPIKENIDKIGFNDCIDVFYKNINYIKDSIRDFVESSRPEIKPKLCAILDAEEHGRQWIDIEVRCGKAKERFPKHYKSYVEMVEYITGRKYRRYKFDLK